MTKNNPTRLNGVRFIFALTILFGGSGCKGELRFESVLWSPDSTKIVYSDHDGARLVEFDLTKQLSRVIVADTQTKTMWPAIRSDGQRLAVCRIDVDSPADSDEEVHSRRIQIYDLDGQLVHQSSPLETKQKKPSNSSFTINVSSIESGLNWSGPHHKILMIDAIYDCDNDKWTRLEEIVPVAMNNQPVRPDGEGFLGCLLGETLVFVDWNGVAKQFAEASADDPAGSSTSTKLKEYQLWFNFGWRNDIAQIEYPDRVLEFDTSAMKVSSRPSAPPRIKSGNEFEAIYRFPGADAQIYIVHKTLDQIYWLIYEKPNANVRKVLLQGSNICWSSFFFYPSPDKRSVAVRYRVKKTDGPSVILIIDEQGSKTLVTVE